MLMGRRNKVVMEMAWKKEDKETREGKLRSPEEDKRRGRSVRKDWKEKAERYFNGKKEKMYNTEDGTEKVEKEVYGMSRKGKLRGKREDKKGEEH